MRDLDFKAISLGLGLGILGIVLGWIIDTVREMIWLRWVLLGIAIILIVYGIVPRKKIKDWSIEKVQAFWPDGYSKKKHHWFKKR